MYMIQMKLIQKSDLAEVTAVADKKTSEQTLAYEEFDREKYGHQEC